MRSIHSVVIDGLNKFMNQIFTEDWAKGDGYELYKAWVELRRHNRQEIVSYTSWHNNIVRKIQDAVDTYSNPVARKHIILRSHFVESFNLHLAIHVMGGYKESRKWEPYINIMVTA
jgi:hypothetical protein